MGMDKDNDRPEEHDKLLRIAWNLELNSGGVGGHWFAKRGNHLVQGVSHLSSFIIRTTPAAQGPPGGCQGRHSRNLLISKLLTKPSY